MTKPPARKAARAQSCIAVGLGAISVSGIVLLTAADAIRRSVHWPDHSPASAAPFFLIAAAIAAVTSVGRDKVGRRCCSSLPSSPSLPGERRSFMPGQAAGPLNDAAIVLFVIDGGYLVVSEARAILTRHPIRDHNLAVSCCAVAAQSCACRERAASPR